MKDIKFPFISIDYASDKESDYSEKEYKKKDFSLQKYQKFKPKAIDNNYKTKALRGAENKVKNILSNFLKNYEIGNNTFDVLNELNRNQKNNELNNNENKNNKIIKKVKTSVINEHTNNKTLIKKVKTSVINKNNKNVIKKVKTSKNKNNKKIINKVKTSVINKKPKIVRTKSYSVSSDKEKKKNNLKIESQFKYPKFQSQKRKVRFNLNPNSSKNNNLNKEYILKKSAKNLNNNYQVNIPKKHFSNKKVFTFGVHALKRNKTIARVDKNININIINNNSNNINTNKIIKRTQTVSENNSYMKFKNDNIFINKNHKNNSILIKALLNRKKSNLKNKNKNNKDIFNESIQNSVLSDLSSSCLNKKSIDMKSSLKEDDSSKNDNKISSIYSIYKRPSLLSTQKYTNLMNIKKNPKDLSAINIKESSIQRSLNPNKIIKRNILNRNNSKMSAFSEEKKRNSEQLKLNMHFKALKEQLKKSIILLPEELYKKSHLKYKKTFMQKKKNSSILIDKKRESTKSQKNLEISTNTNGINSRLIKEQNNNLKNENINNNNTGLEVEESKKLDKDQNLEEKSKNSSYEDYSTKALKRKFEKYRILTLKPSLYDSLNDDDYEDEEDIAIIYLDPNSLFTIIFDSILFVVTIISLIDIPFYLAINKHFCRNKTITMHFSINFFIDIINIIDLFLGFFRAYYNWEEQLIKKKRKIALKYLSGWFLFDLIASIPIYTINKIYEPECIENEIISKYSNMVINNLHYLFISNRLFKVFKVFLNNQAWNIISNKLNDRGNIILYISLIFAAINYTACFYIFIGRNSYPNWIFKTQLDSETFINIYICAIYILTMAVTTVGYGDITCYSMNEIFFQLFILIIGIIGYSYVVSFVSNYIVKINEKSVEFEKKKEILDEIKLSHPNLPDELYDKIIRYLKFKNIKEKKLKNIIFDCLPVGLKNNLITEMYKPIIQNFIFFKNFQNTDFIIKVILAFKPIIAYKNDILVNEGDMVEDIMFVKNGVLSVEIPINMSNPQENIEKYLDEPKLEIEKGPNVEKLGNSTIIQQNDTSSKNILFNSTTQNDLNNKNSNNYNSTLSFYTLKYSSILNTKISRIEKERKEKEEKERRKKLIYVKILGIRENEHFGDVLMFLEERSPLRVRVKTIKCELFFLKKIDAVNISANHQNLWKRINKKSVFNFEQMKKSIKNIVEIYCAVREIKSSYLKKYTNKKEKAINPGRNKSNFNMTILKTIKEEDYIKNSQSQKNIKINYINFFKNKEIHVDDFILDNNNIKNKNLSAINLERKINFVLSSNNSGKSLSSSNSSLPSKLSSKKKNIQKSKNKNTNNDINQNISGNQLKFGQKVLETYNKNYKYYEGAETKDNNESKKEHTIITEETEQEGSIDNGFNTILRKSKIPSIKNNVYSSKSVNNDILNNNKEEKISETDNSYNRIINNELQSDEAINIIKEENLLNKKIDLDIVSQKQSDINNNINKSLKKKSKLKKLLKLLENKNDDNINSDENSNENSNEDKDDIDSQNLVSNDSIESSDTPPKKMNAKKLNPIRKKNANFLSINKNISFKIKSSYENLNVISGKILIKSKRLQNKLKNYLLDEIQNISELDTNINKNKNMFSEEIKKINTFGAPIYSRDKRNNKVMNSPKADLGQFSPSPFDFRKNQLFNRNDSFHYSKSIDKKSKRLNNSFSLFINNKIDKNSKINKIQTGPGVELKKGKVSQFETLNKNVNKINIINNNINYIKNSTLDRQKNNKPKKISSIKKKRDNSLSNNNSNLLSQINLNIQKTNQNLNNPEQFYSSYFNSLLEGKKNEKTVKRNSIFY